MSWQFHSNMRSKNLNYSISSTKLVVLQCNRGSQYRDTREVPLDEDLNNTFENNITDMLNLNDIPIYLFLNFSYIIRIIINCL